jgi:glycosyltransferase involved in cell wall biosynthesis
VFGLACNDRPLRVGLNLLFLGARAGGVGRYARELPGALLAAEPRTEITVFLANDVPDDIHTEPWAGRVRLVTLPLATGSRTLQLSQYLALPALAAAHGLDVLHSPANSGPVITPWVASVVSVMDLIWLHRAADWEPDPRAQRAMRRLVAHSLRHADRVFAISRAAADDFLHSFEIPGRRIVVTPLGVRLPTLTPTPEAELRERLGVGRARVLLCVAQKRRYKNLETLIRALPTLDADVVLALPGSSTAYEDELRILADQLGVTDRLCLPEWLSEAELAGLYALSTAFALPSLIEGFGLPVLEAMAHGLPVACSDIPALNEVAGTAALLFDPGDQESINDSLRRLLASSDLRQELVARGRDQAARFTWAQTGAASLRGYREAIGDPN